MAAKKLSSAVVYTPLNKAAGVSSLIEQKINLIPPYEDSGVKYQGKYKTQIGNDTYELKGQLTRFNGYGTNAMVAGVTEFFPRTRPQTKFFCTRMIIMWHAMTSHNLESISLGDSIGGNVELKYVFYPNVDDGQQILDFSDCPRLYTGDNFSILSSVNTGTGWVTVMLYGWEEQK